MPTASVGRLEKQASFDSCEPLRQGITMIEHKIRNLEKRKARLDSCRDLQKSGKDLNSDQLDAISKYDAVIQHLDFARELSKQLTTLANDTAKTLKKQARKEAAEKAQQDLGKMKEVLMIQDVLANMGTETVREDFLQGKNNVKLTSEELQSIDDLYICLTPKKDEPQVFSDMFQTPAETMMALIEGKPKEAFGTTYSALKTKLIEISKSGYFDTTPPPPPEVVAPPVEPEPVQEFVQPEKLPEMMKMEDIERTQIASAQNMAYSQTTAKPSIPPPHVIPQEQYSYAHPPQPDVMTNAQTLEAAYFNPHLRVFQSGTIDFMQENEIDVPETGEQPPSAIPSMTYTNQNYGSPMEHSHPPPPPVEPQPYQNQTDEEKGWSTVPTNSIEPSIEQTNSTPNAWGTSPSIVMDQPQNNTNNVGAGGDDWASQTDHWQQSQQNNDGFITAGGTRGRGSRGRSGGGGDRNKGFQKGGRGGTTGRGGYRGDKGDGYRERDNRDGYNRDGGFSRNDAYYKDHNSSGYQNGYQSGSRGGNRNRNNQSSDRPGGRGGNRGRGSGGYRGGNQSGNYRQPVQ